MRRKMSSDFCCKVFHVAGLNPQRGLGRGGVGRWEHYNCYGIAPHCVIFCSHGSTNHASTFQLKLNLRNHMYFKVNQLYI